MSIDNLVENWTLDKVYCKYIKYEISINNNNSPNYHDRIK